MIGGTGATGTMDISQYLINFNSADWAKQANSYIQSSLDQGMDYSQKYAQAALDSQKGYQQQANQYQQGGYEMAQALNAPQRMAGYGALDAYQDSLGLARPSVGSFQLASSLENNAKQQAGLQNQLTPQQSQTAASFNQGLLGPVQKV